MNLPNNQKEALLCASDRTALSFYIAIGQAYYLMMAHPSDLDGDYGHFADYSRLGINTP